MKVLLDIPFVVYFANWVWGEDPDVTAESCLDQFLFMETPCWTRLLVKGIGVAIILGSFLNKTPVMINMLNSRSAAGLSASAVYGECLVYANGAAYGLLNAHPFTAWGENGALLLQNCVILLLMWEYNQSSSTTRMAVSTIGILYVSIVANLPTEYYFGLMASIMPILLYARGSQILETFRCRHTGAQSIITTSLSLVGGLIRILTTIKEVGWDMNVLGTFILSSSLNLTMFVQYFVYQSNTQKFLTDLQRGSEKKES